MRTQMTHQCREYTKGAPALSPTTDPARGRDAAVPPASAEHRNRVAIPVMTVTGVTPPETCHPAPPRAENPQRQENEVEP
jgi:hypothetical protein